jgi:hypothetical protein
MLNYFFKLVFRVRKCVCHSLDVWNQQIRMQAFDIGNVLDALVKQVAYSKFHRRSLNATVRLLLLVSEVWSLESSTTPALLNLIWRKSYYMGGGKNFAINIPAMRAVFPANYFPLHTLSGSHNSGISLSTRWQGALNSANK